MWNIDCRVNAALTLVRFETLIQSKASRTLLLIESYCFSINAERQRNVG